MRLFWLLCLVPMIASCTTNPYLKARATTGTLSSINPACPGTQEVINFSPQKLPWVMLRIYATPPGKYESRGTELRIQFELLYAQGTASEDWSLFFPKEKEGISRKATIEARSNMPYVITASAPSATIITPDGQKKTIMIPMFKEPFDAKEDIRKSWWRNGLEISPRRLDKFTVLLPNIYVNGEAFNVSPIEFQLGTSRYFPVLNC